MCCIGTYIYVHVYICVYRYVCVCIYINILNNSSSDDKRNCLKL